MGVEIDWSKAPERAIAALVRQPLFVDRVETFHEAGIEYFCGEDVSGLPYRLHGGRVTKVDRPSTWTGKGLPPVGTVCEYSFDAKRWYECHVRYVLDNDHHPDADGWKAVVWCPHLEKEQVAYLPTFKFCPIKSPEQIAAEEREKAIQELIQVTCITHGEAARIHDAGYRKVAQ